MWSVYDIVWWSLAGLFAANLPGLPLMFHVRLFTAMVGAYFSAKPDILDGVRLSLRVWVSECDLNLHMNNASYYAVADLGRYALAVGTGMASYARTHGLYLANGGVSLLFKRELKTFMRHPLRRIPLYKKLSQDRRSQNPHLGNWYSQEFRDHYEAPYNLGDPDSLTQELRRSVECKPLPLYLRVEDRMSMAHSVESRLPFMDYRLVSLLFNTPDNWKLRDHWNKYILRQAMKDQIPDSVSTRVDKMGFPAAEKNWVAGPYFEPLQDMLSSQNMRERSIYNVETIRNDLERHRKGETNVSIELFRIAQFELWNDSVDKPVQQQQIPLSA